MTITLHWWFIPLALAVTGIGVFLIDERNDYGPGRGCVGAIICAACWMTALGVCIGRWLA